jgi:hypothetical protein
VLQKFPNVSQKRNACLQGAEVSQTDKQQDSRICGFHGGDYGKSLLLGSYAVWLL